MSRFNELIKDKKLMSGLYALTLITALLVLALVIRGPEKSGSLIVDEKGSVIGIHREKTSSSERYELSISVKDGDDEIERDVSLTLQAHGNSKVSAGMSSRDEREAALDAAIDTIISEVEQSGSRKIMLPLTLPDGTAVEWRSRENKSGSEALMIPIMYLSLAAMMIAPRFKEDDGNKEVRRSILRGLPRFCNQLFLMMNAGLILSDAFDMITESYEGFGKEGLSSFEAELAGLREATDHHRVSTADVINEYAVKHDVKELIRIATILTENERRGSDVIESLERESRYLWDGRKVTARECGKMIDTKMSYPLGMLLILLIVITMAPALLSM